MFIIQPIQPVTRALVLALAVCYHARLPELDDHQIQMRQEDAVVLGKARFEYRKRIASVFKAPCVLPGGHEQFEEEISRCVSLYYSNES